ncbi:zinc-binding dehydrogenase [Gordonia sp. KTR9]|uniref:zinc-binding dehydrogenase n=1 Tax=Gordonia sp. KTR9 TaxID=337191 RepID=UPI00027DD95B|nr:zinc-binding dehydrogenase [Gordonia sp. KTR9]AFR46885.1 alcohol dehydrogenase, zinc-containing [Gordonia sp. KTR9]
MRRARSIVFRGQQAGLDCVERDVPPPGSAELVVQVTHAGVCGSDGHHLTGEVAATGTDRGYTAISAYHFGHEGIGTIVELGSGVSADRAGAPLSVGDRVFWSPPTPCGVCESCTADWPTALCANLDWPQGVGRPSSASYQDFATISTRAAYFRIPDSAASDAVIAFGCAMPTALGGLRRLGGVSAGATVVIQGNGPVGLAATMLFGLGPASRIVVIGEPGERMTAAENLGATHTVSLPDTDETQRLQYVRDLTAGRGADVVVEAAGHVSAFDEAVPMLGLRGRLLVLGLFSGGSTVPFNPVLVNNREISIIGSLGCPIDDYGRSVELADRHGDALGLHNLVTHRFPLEQVTEAITAATSGVAVKAVVNP